MLPWADHRENGPRGAFTPPHIRQTTGKIFVRVEVLFILCTEASLYAPYSLLLISNKFWMEGGGGWEGGESVGEKQGGRVGGRE
jgi:hypothetical protein